MHVIAFIRSRRYLTVLTGFALLAVGVTLLVFFVRIFPGLFAEVTDTGDDALELARFERAVQVRQVASDGAAAGGDDLPSDDPAVLDGPAGWFRPVKGTRSGDDVLVLDAAAGSVLRLTPEGRLDETPLAAPLPAPPAAPRYTDIEVSDTGTYLVTDLANGQVWAFAADGRFLGPFLPATARLESGLTKPTAVARDPQGRVAISDVGDHTVKVFDKTGSLVLTMGGFGHGQGRLNYPADVIADDDGRFIVADSQNRAIQVFSAEGAFVREFSQTSSGGGLVLPRTLALDARGRLHVVDAFEERVWVFAPDTGDFLGSYGVKVPVEQRFGLPEAIVVNGDRVTVGDRANGRLVVYGL